jgi:phospholipid/cholesterol/gamma-HCH transport system permease protein
MTVGGGVCISAILLDVNPEQFISHIPQFVSLKSIGLGMVKSLLFGFMIGTVSCFFGYHTSGGAEAVGKTVRKTSVVVMVAIIVVDFLVSTSGESLSNFVESWGGG